MKIKKIITVLLAICLSLGLFAGCGEKGANTVNSELTKDIKAKLTIGCYSPIDSGYYAEKDLEAEFQKLYPNVSIEIEEYKDTGEYENAMKMRITGNELPDIMYLQPDMINTYKDYLVELNDLPVASDNVFYEDYQEDGKLYALPTSSGETYVFYWKELFDKANIEIPDTWNEFEEACLKLKDYYIQENPDFIALGMGAKDEWPTYPFAEYMPALESGNGDEWTKMAAMDTPFEKGGDVYNAYKKIYDLFNSGVCGSDPLGVGHDQLAALFREKKVGMMVFAPSLYASIKSAGTDISDLSTFYLPTRDSENDEFRTLVAGNTLLAVTKNSKNTELAKEFLNFFFSEDWYPEYINSKDDGSALNSFSKTKEPTLQAADDLQPDPVNVGYLGGDQNFINIVSKTKFDCKKLGAQFFVDGFDFDSQMNELDKLWTEARKDLGIN